MNATSRTCLEEADLEGEFERFEEEEAEEAAEEAIVTEAEGLRLHLSPNSATGYLGVYLERGKFCAQTKVGGQGARRIFLGTFGTAVEAAVAYARRVGEAAAPLERQETELRRWFPAIYEIDGKWRLCFVGKTSSSSDWWRTSGCVERLGDSARASTRFRTVNGTVYLLVGKCEVSPSRSTGYLDPNALRFFASGIPQSWQRLVRTNNRARGDVDFSAQPASSSSRPLCAHMFITRNSITP